MARTNPSQSPSKGISCFLVEKGTKGLNFGKQENKMGWNSQPTAAVILEDCEISAEQLIGIPGQGFQIAMAALDGGRINIGTTAIGGAISAYNKALNYVNERSQFNQKLSSFQNTQFILSDMASLLTSSRLLIHLAADLLEQKHSQATMHCAMAKRFSTDSASLVANQALQLHGGYGYLKEFGIERIVRDLRVHQILEVKSRSVTNSTTIQHRRSLRALETMFSLSFRPSSQVS